MLRSSTSARSCKARPLTFALLAGLAPFAAGGFTQPLSAQGPCDRTVVANVVAMDQVLVWNKFGSANPVGQIYALGHEVTNLAGTGPGMPGDVKLRDGIRPRPLTLRVNKGDCLQVNFRNLLSPDRAGLSAAPLFGGTPPLPDFRNDSPKTRTASFHVAGLEYVNIGADGAKVSVSQDSLVNPGDSATYTFYAAYEGQYLASSFGALAGGEGDGGSLAHGLFGSVCVEPEGSKWLHSSTGESLLGDVSGGDPTHPTHGLGANVINSATCYAIVYDFNDPDDNIEFTPEGPFREFMVFFHDENKTFHQYDPLNHEFWLHSVRDTFAINYGIGGIGSMLTQGIGAPDGRYEEMFLTSWSQGDPALLSQFTDDPSNVFHSYLGDRVKIRFLHAGPKETHIFHLHAHQWVFAPNDENSTYLDSQAVGPGSSYDFDICYGGSGNRNMTAGDSIFHCHLYPHFAQGMWALWRVHDVFEDGSRLLPDLTPIPRVAPIPGKPLPPLPTAQVPGYPFFIPGVPGEDGVAGYNGDYRPGHRPPQSPMEMGFEAGLGESAGLPRHVMGNRDLPNAFINVLAGTPVDQAGTSHPGNWLGLSLDAELIPGSMSEKTAVAQGQSFAAIDPSIWDVIFLPQGGTLEERIAMAFHAATDDLDGDGVPEPELTGVAELQAILTGAVVGGGNGAGGDYFPGKIPSVVWNTPTVDPTEPDYAGRSIATPFKVNGLPPAPGSPYANPCPPGAPDRLYKASVIDFDLVVNNTGWHDPQARFNVLDGDVAGIGTRGTAEPFFFRANSNDCITFQHTNRTKREMHEDDFQVLTPTDTIGQHIHLVKFDVMTADGSGNGWNYEDATFSYEEVDDRFEAMNYGAFAAGSADWTNLGIPANEQLAPRNGRFQATVQRWWADPLLNGAGEDRTIRTVYTHDHFGPSTIQQHGHYGALVIEPEGSVWKDSITGTTLGTRDDGGPTSWRADIIYDNGTKGIREFCLAVADFAIVYDETHQGIGRNGAHAINPPRDELGAITPEAVSADDPGTMLMNYRNEPIPLRVGEIPPTGSVFTNQRKPGRAGRLPYALDSALHGDPGTPLMTAFQGDTVQVRIIQGAQEDSHSFAFNRLKWQKEIVSPDSKWVAAQHMGISEHFEMQTTAVSMDPLPTGGPPGGGNGNGGGRGGGGGDIAPTARPVTVDLLWWDNSEDGLWNGVWGIFRLFGTPGTRDPVTNRRVKLQTLPDNPDGMAVTNMGDFKWPCPKTAPERDFNISAVLVSEVTGDPRGIVYNAAADIYDDTGLMYVLDEDLDIPLYIDGSADVLVDGLTNTYSLATVGNTWAITPLPGAVITVSGFVNGDNNGLKTVVSATATTIVVSETLVAEAAGAAVSMEGRPSLKPGVAVEAFVIRANAGDCLSVKLTNRLPTSVPDNRLTDARQTPIVDLNIHNFQTDPTIGMSIDMCYADAGGGGESSVIGRNTNQLVDPGTSKNFTYFAGDLVFDPATGVLTPVSRNYGVCNIRTMGDIIKQGAQGLIGALIVEPEGSAPYGGAVGDAYPTGTVATIAAPGAFGEPNSGVFKEFVVLQQDGLNLFQGGTPGANGGAPNVQTNTVIDAGDDPEDAGDKAYSYNTTPFAANLTGGDVTTASGHDTPWLNDQDLKDVLTQNPPLLFTAGVGDNVVFRLAQPTGRARAHVFSVHGHNWWDDPGNLGPGCDPAKPKSNRVPVQNAHTVGHRFNIWLKAGGAQGVRGDYLFHEMASFQFSQGLWGILRVQ